MVNNKGLPLELGFISRNLCVFPAVKLNLPRAGPGVPRFVRLGLHLLR